MDFQSNLHNRCRNKIELKKGYVALIAVLAISALLMVIGISVTIISINQGQMSTVEQKKEKALFFVESCGSEALMNLNKNGSVPATIILPTGTCTTTVSNAGSTWTITVTGSQENYKKTIQIVATRGSNVTINSWNEI